MKDIEKPHDHDVLSGRGNFVNYHPGNEHFRNLVKSHKISYVACPKPQKGKFSRLIVDEIRSMDPPGRFLKQDDKTKMWYDIGDKKALDKTRQALREGAPELLKELTEPEENCEAPVLQSQVASLQIHTQEGINQALPQRFNVHHGLEKGSAPQAANDAYEPILVGKINALSQSCPPSLQQQQGRSVGLQHATLTSVALKDPDYNAPKLKTLSAAAAAELVSRIPASELEPNPIYPARQPMRHRPALFGTPKSASWKEPPAQTQNGDSASKPLPDAVFSAPAVVRSDSMTFEDLMASKNEHREKEPKNYASSCNMSISIGDLGNESNLSNLFQDSLVIDERSVYSAATSKGGTETTPPARIRADKRGSMSSEISLGVMERMETFGASTATMTFVEEDKES